MRDRPGSLRQDPASAVVSGRVAVAVTRRWTCWPRVAATSRASVLSGYGQAAAKLGLDHAGDAEAVAAPGSWPGWTGTGRGWWCSMICAMRLTASGLCAAGAGRAGS